MLRNNRIYLALLSKHKDIATTVAGKYYHTGPKLWSFPVQHAVRLKFLFPDYLKEIEDDIQTLKGQQKSVDSIMEEIQDGGTQANSNHDMDVTDQKIPEDSAFKLKPYEHQKTMLKAGFKYSKFAYLCEMGTGKTKVICDLIQFHPEIKRALVICPKTVIYSWTHDLELNTNLKYNVITGTKKKREELLNGQADVSIINYEGLLAIGNSDVWSQFDTVILDESSKIKNNKARRTKLILQVFENTPRKYILSGTPITQNPADIYCQFRFLDKSLLGFKSYYAFRNTYCIMGGYQNYQIVGFKNLPQLKSSIKKHSIQLKKEDCLDLPKKIYKKLYLDMPPVLKKQYTQMKQEMILEVQQKDEPLTARMAMTMGMRLQQILSGAYLPDNFKDNPKVEAIADILEEIGDDQSLVIWFRFRDSLDLMQRYFEKRKIECSIIHGDINDRQKQIEDFQSGRKRIFLGQLQAGGIGITLHRAAVTTYFENDFSLETRKQSEDRTHRIGQSNTCVYYDIIYNGSIERKVIKALGKKQDVATSLVSSFLAGDFSMED